MSTSDKTTGSVDSTENDESDTSSRLLHFYWRPR